MAAIRGGYGYEFLIRPVGQKRPVNLAGRSLFRLGFSASEIVRFDCHEMPFGILGMGIMLPGPGGWRARRVLSAPLEWDLIVANRAPLGKQSIPL
jgi:hypothetical protein